MAKFIVIRTTTNIKSTGIDLALSFITIGEINSMGLLSEWTLLVLQIGNQEDSNVLKRQWHCRIYSSVPGIGNILIVFPAKKIGKAGEE